MGIKWTAMLKAEFEMEDRAPENLAETRLRTAVGEFQRIIETGVIGAGTGVKHGSVRVEVLAFDRRVP
jgi:hypothetical protein